VTVDELGAEQSFNRLNAAFALPIGLRVIRRRDERLGIEMVGDVVLPDPRREERVAVAHDGQRAAKTVG